MWRFSYMSCTGSMPVPNPVPSHCPSFLQLAVGSGRVAAQSFYTQSVQIPFAPACRYVCQLGGFCLGFAATFMLVVLRRAVLLCGRFSFVWYMNLLELVYVSSMSLSARFGQREQTLMLQAAAVAAARCKYCLQSTMASQQHMAGFEK